ncbi:HalD/BesD family halogenase [Nonomuraea sp. LPB2021202275-12-8]|uniref:HalD/BesD family halogenase n=1 Tax=Nonomuraea sp. LPB2021202275-12-8 TaxID=3120159 RepID=UPI00300D7C32
MTITCTTDLAGEFKSRLLDVDQEELDEARKGFRTFGFAKVSFAVPPSIKAAVASDVTDLVEKAGIRRDLTFRETGDTPRRMRNVRQEAINAHSSIIPSVYSEILNHGVLDFVAGEEVLPCPYLPERYVITSLERNGDTHGWHWDDYSFALVWVIECPPAQFGGFVQCVPNSQWNKRDPQVNRILANNPIYSLELGAGDLYLMRTDTTMHRVYPVEQGRRVIINMGYAAHRDLAKQISHETMDDLWSIDLPA